MAQSRMPVESAERQTPAIPATSHKTGPTLRMRGWKPLTLGDATGDLTRLARGVRTRVAWMHWEEIAPWPNR